MGNRRTTLVPKDAQGVVFYVPRCVCSTNIQEVLR